MLVALVEIVQQHPQMPPDFYPLAFLTSYGDCELAKAAKLAIDAALRLACVPMGGVDV